MNTHELFTDDGMVYDFREVSDGCWIATREAAPNGQRLRLDRPGSLFTTVGWVANPDPPDHDSPWDRWEPPPMVGFPSLQSAIECVVGLGPSWRERVPEHLDYFPRRNPR